MLCVSFCKCSNLQMQRNACFFQCDAASANPLCQRGKAVICSQILTASYLLSLPSLLSVSEKCRIWGGGRGC